MANLTVSQPGCLRKLAFPGRSSRTDLRIGRGHVCDDRAVEGPPGSGWYVGGIGVDLLQPEVTIVGWPVNISDRA